MKGVNFERFSRYLFDSAATARFAAEVLKAILKADSPRFSDIARALPGNTESAYRKLQRFLAVSDPRLALHRLFQVDAPFVLGDPTEMPRPNAWKTNYVGRLREHEPGFWLLLLATPCAGRAIPFHFITYSSRTLALDATSRNQQHLRAFAGIKDLLGERPLVLDREFSYEWLLQALVHERVHFVIRLNLGSQPLTLLNRQGKQLELCVAQGATVRHYAVRYRGHVVVNLIGTWRAGISEPLWVMTDLSPERGLECYQQRMLIEETFRDLKNLLHLDKLMNQQQTAMEKLVALTLLAFTIGYWVGAEFRDVLFPPRQPPAAGHRPSPATAHAKHSVYSSLYVFLKVKSRLPAARQQQIVALAQARFAAMVRGDVRTFV